MHKKLFLLLILFVLPAAAQTIAIRAGNLLDPAKGTVSKDQIILVENGKITAVGAGLPIPKDAQVVDLSKEWVMPGLIDAHTHITFQEIPGKAPFEAMYLKEGSPYRALRGLHNGQVLLNAGFTTMREVGNEADYACSDLKKAIRAGWFDGPTLQCAGKIIGPFGGQSKGMPEEVGGFWLHEYIDADSPDEIRKAIHQNIYYGADVIKLATDNSDYFYTEEEIRAAVDEAHNAGRALAVHVYGGRAADNVIRGGADSVEHGFTLTEAQLKLMKEKGTFLVGTDFPAAHLAGLNPSNETLADANKLGNQIIERLSNANKIGVKMAFGSDTVTEMAGRTRADMVFDYLAVWRAAGVTPADILKAMTTNGAELLRINKDRGAISPGLFADIIAMPGDPIQDIESLRKVNFVMKNGKIVRATK
ncbi:MAG TPA: amidohydrolase family protein [Candidatus Acidoferrum sp.]|jgi:imidazolonepropionase-like amidohydrolase|nr:amidohydrolase family protein [Candidatus Acidoferrum sp.]